MTLIGGLSFEILAPEELLPLLHKIGGMLENTKLIFAHIIEIKQ